MPPGNATREASTPEVSNQRHPRRPRPARPSPRPRPPGPWSTRHPAGSTHPRRRRWRRRRWRGHARVRSARARARRRAGGSPRVSGRLHPAATWTYSPRRWTPSSRRRARGPRWDGVGGTRSRRGGAGSSSPRRRRRRPPARRGAGAWRRSSPIPSPLSCSRATRFLARRPWWTSRWARAGRTAGMKAARLRRRRSRCSRRWSPARAARRRRRCSTRGRRAAVRCLRPSRLCWTDRTPRPRWSCSRRWRLGQRRRQRRRRRRRRTGTGTMSGTGDRSRGWARRRLCGTASTPTGVGRWT
mmetsp:Transcript_9153/g.41643  ORF Transcript_9153/g.41643 Transcript_9153/m.41643 type:complete len:299 (-) Transcript_9153:180-1076(-)